MKTFNIQVDITFKAKDKNDAQNRLTDALYQLETKGIKIDEEQHEQIEGYDVLVVTEED